MSELSSFRVTVEGPVSGGAVELPADSTAAHVWGRWASWPGVTVARVWRVRKGRLTASLPDSELRFVLGAGDTLAWDVDRERVALVADEGGVSVEAETWVAAAPLLLGVARRLALRRPQGLTPSRLADGVVARVGGTAVLYVAALAALSVAAGSAVPLVAGTSFVHYCLYIATYHHRDGVAFPRFVRDVVFFKALSMFHLAWITVGWWAWSPVSVALIGVGLAVSCRAAHVLGFERTYFGFELGRVASVRVTRFPYGVIPHPMILGAIVALLGVAAQPAVTAAWPWLVPGHVLLYGVHLAQEMWPARRGPVVHAAGSARASEPSGTVTPSGSGA